MSYSIGEVSKITGIAISTLRYYDREGLFPCIARSKGGIRVFSQEELSALHMIECLKMTDMPLKDIKQFLDWCQEGDATLLQRRTMFYERLTLMKEKMDDLQRTIHAIEFKCWYYDTAMNAGTEAVVKNMPAEEIPADIRSYRYEAPFIK